MGGTWNQIIQRNFRKLKKKSIKTPALKKSFRVVRSKRGTRVRKYRFLLSPQKSGVCLRNVTIRAPKKPNSAKRRVVKVRLSNYRIILCYIPGESGAHNLQRDSKVLIRGGRVQDLPGVHYKVMRGKLDCYPVLLRRSARSKYGVKLEWAKKIGNVEEYQKRIEREVAAEMETD